MSESIGKYDPRSEKPSEFLGNWADGSIAEKEERELLISEYLPEYIELTEKTIRTVGNPNPSGIEEAEAQLQELRDFFISHGISKEELDSMIPKRKYINFSDSDGFNSPGTNGPSC